MSVGTSKSLLVRLTLVGIVVLLIPLGTRAQQDSSSEQPRNEQPASAEADQQSGESSSRVPTSPMPSQPQILQLGRATPLGESWSHLRWGSLYIASIDFLQLYSKLEAPDLTSPLTRVTSLFRTTLVFDRSSRRSRLALQYQPRLAVVNGQVRTNLLNQVLALDLYYQVSPRWTLNFGDSFHYAQNQHFIPEDSIQVGGLSGSIVRGNLLDTAGRWIQNEAYVGANHQMSPRTEFKVGGYYGYGLTGVTNEPFAEAHYYGASAGLSRAFTPKTRLGLGYEIRVVGGGGGAPKTVSHTMRTSYSYRLGPTWGFHSTMGATFIGRLPEQPRYWTATGTALLVKTFGRSTLGLTYDRGQSFAGYVTNRVADRADVSYGFRWSGRFQTNFGVGYYRDNGFGAPSNSGKFGVANLRYRLAPNFVLMADYARKVQDVTTVQLLAGTRDIYLVGIRWEPPAKR